MSRVSYSNRAVAEDMFGVQSGPQKTVPYIILFKMLLHLFIRTK